ncbi:MAG TPA: ABC transporter permease [Chryseolinea sp.]|nr:ABC transporter permease [Chryseolinea sp.]
MKQHPPRLAKSILRRFCHVSFLEEVEGDLDEQFYERLEGSGSFKARLHYWIDVTRAVASGNGYGRKEPRSRVTIGDSLAHFFKIFFRNLKHNRSSSFINIAGLALSLMSFVAIYLYVSDELTFDSFHPDADNVYRISHSYKRHGDGIAETDARAGGLFVVALKEAMPEVEAYTRFSRFGYPGFVKNEKANIMSEEQQFFWVDSSYAKIFSLPMVSGDPSVILRDPHNVIINESMAKKYFGTADPIGQELIYSRTGMAFNFVVAGIMRDYPSNAHFHPDYMASNVALGPLWKRDGYDRVNDWGDAFTYSFFRLAEGTDPTKAKEALTRIFREHLNPERTDLPVLTKLTNLHFTHGMLVELELPGDKMYAYIAASVGVIVLIIAAINYMNLATARSVRRSREVGLRKTLGVRRSSLIFQFIGESIVLVSISFVISLIFTVVLLPFFNQLTGKAFDIYSVIDGNALPILLGVILILALLSGSYPAFYLSRFKPGDILKGKIITGTGAENFRKTLVVFQFSMTVLLIVSAAVIHNQLTFIQSGKLAAQKEKIMTVRLADVGNQDQLRQSMSQNKEVEELSFSDHLPRQSNMGFIMLPFVLPSLGKEEHMWDGLRVDESFATMFNLELLEGRNFSSALPADTSNFIMNEAAVRSLNLTPEQAVGLQITINIDYWDASHHVDGKVIGVVKDFPYGSVREAITPMVLSGRYQHSETMNIRLSGDNYSEAIASIEKSWKKMYPSNPFKYWFLDQEFGRLYKQEMQMGKLADYFTGFTIVIACLGLFGLASFTAEQKTKEIGIRKVLGASIGQILVLLTNKFIRLVLISYVIAIPLALYAMNSWLENFAYKVPLHWSAFVGAGLLILVLTYITVGIESIRAAVANPVDSIRHE